MSQILITTQDYQRLKQQIHLAKANPTIAPRQRQALTQCVDGATLVDPRTIPANVVTMNSRVKIVYLDNHHRTLELKLVYPQQVDVPQNQISIFAPLATALLGCKQHDVIRLPVLNRTLNVKIDRILYQPEAAGDYAL
ncbi:GreA/GreB family elongation factor [Larkinella arboricola]|nr:GreA/GreB family elongation factor [Larkinella arboricola]